MVLLEIMEIGYLAGICNINQYPEQMLLKGRYVLMSQ